MCKEVIIQVSPELTHCDPHRVPVLIIGQHKHLLTLKYADIAPKFETRVSETMWQSGVESLQPSPTDSVSLYLNLCTVAALPHKISRHNTNSRAHSITKIVRSNLVSACQEFVVLVCEREDLYASVCAVARAYGAFSRKSSVMNSNDKQTITIEVIFVGKDLTKLSAQDVNVLNAAIYGVRMAARIVETPANEMTTTAFLEEIKVVGDKLKIKPTIISGEELKKRGFGGIYGVGKAAVCPPALAVLSHTPPGASQTIAWVGKGIVYDTGGLSMKTKTSMPGMKRDCGGAAGILGAFYVAISAGFNQNLHAVFCLAENAVGPNATKPDDIHTLYSGHTVEINNTDAEGRLVLGDGVVYAFKDLNSSIIIDMATLTGAQSTTTGKFHAAALTNCDLLELAVVRAGRTSGDLVHPIVYAPEMHFTEFASPVADMKNSASDRCNAASSCAGLFIHAQLGFNFPGKWLHLDMASPVVSGERATGYGVALLSVLFGSYSESDILKRLGPSVPSADLTGQQNNNNDADDLDVDGITALNDQPSSKKTRLDVE